MQSNYSPYILLRPLRWQVLRFIEGELHLEWYLICCEYHKITAGIDYHSSWMTHVIRARWSRHVVQERIENIGSKFVCLSKRWSFFVWHWHSINKYCVLKCSRLSLMSIKKLTRSCFFRNCFSINASQTTAHKIVTMLPWKKVILYYSKKILLPGEIVVRIFRPAPPPSLAHPRLKSPPSLTAQNCVPSSSWKPLVHIAVINVSNIFEKHSIIKGKQHWSVKILLGIE